MSTPNEAGRPRMGTLLLLRFLVYLVVGYSALVLLLYLMQDRILYPASRDIYRDPSAYGWAFDDITLPVNGEETHAWFVPLEGARGTVLFSHGNAGNIADRLESIGLLRELGFSVLAYDYGGYGKSTGRTSEDRVYADIRAMWGYLTETRGKAPEEIVLFGRSMGGGATLQLATETTPAAVILESTYLSTVAVARGMFLLRFMPLDLLVRDRYDNESKIQDITAPVLIIHSPDDEIIPYHHGQRLYELAPEPKQFLEIHGGHNTGFVDSANYRPGWEAFLEEILPRRNPR